MITSLFNRSIFRGKAPEMIMPTTPLRDQFYECKQVVQIKGEDVELVSYGRNRSQARDRMIDKMLIAGIPIGDAYEQIPEPEVV